MGLLWIFPLLFMSFIISLSCLIALFEDSRTTLNRFIKYRQPYFLPGLHGKALNFSPFDMIIAISLSQTIFIMLKYVSPIPSLSKTFIMKEWGILSEVVFISVEMLSVLECINVVNQYFDSCMLYHFSISLMKPTWPWRIIYLVCLCNGFQILSWNFLYLYLSGRLAYNSLILLDHLFWYQSNTGFICVQKHLFIFYFIE